MAPTTRKRARPAAPTSTAVGTGAVAGPSQAPQDEQNDTKDDFTDILTDHESANSDFEVEDSKKRKRSNDKGKGKKPKPVRRLTAFNAPPAPPLPLPALPDENERIFDDESGESDGYDDGLFSKERRHNASALAKATNPEVPKKLTLTVGGIDINIDPLQLLATSNLVDLLKSPSMLLLLKNAGLTYAALPISPATSSASTNTGFEGDNNSGAIVQGFLKLPPEVRNKIYDLLFLSKHPVDFTANQNHSHSAQFLSTCKTVYNEGRAVLYGNNSFHFTRDSRVRANYFDQVWAEVGFKDVRRFLGDIRPHNIALLQHISCTFTDAADNRTRTVTGQIQFRRFVDDPHVHKILEYLAANTTLKTFAVQFAGRSMVTKYDRRFMRTLTDIKCYKLVMILYLYGNNHKCAMDLREKMKELMKARDDNGEYVTLQEPKYPVKMVYDRDSATVASVIWPFMKSEELK